MRNVFLTLSLAAFAAAGSAAAQERERCYGVALAGANDGIAEAEAPGAATLDYQGDAWTLTPPGACLTLPLPAQADGTPRRGSYEPLSRDRP